jgi:hypothetical protein
VVQHHLQAFPADLCLELIGGSAGDYPSAVDHRDGVCQLVGFLEVLRREQHVGAVGDQPSDDLPGIQPAAGV